ncbi:glucoamylase family protein [Spirosoma foliorum]|uniref:Ig-like domain-containing protein n=1 Tax=Spirosoma foliorum TaxID=2710596 RepID=A0A7G5GRW8_9BACT|nr:glucoamylase family protein [Spirosoma foliorum]QMW01610.1 Ig-like domain-containing protein [Spirosoma foliorum]
MNTTKLIGLLFLVVAGLSCKKTQDVEPPESFYFHPVQVNGQASSSMSFQNVGANPVITISFSAPLQKESVAKAIQLSLKSTGVSVPLNYTVSSGDTVITATPQSSLSALTAYQFTVQPTLTSARNSVLNSTVTVNLTTSLDNTDKFPRISDSLLLDLVQKQTFKYFWDFGHPVSGLARERNSSGDIVTSGGSGFGVMAILVGINRNFITRQQGLTRLTTITNFLTNNAKRYHGAFPHWLNGATGATVPFSAKDDGADLVETSYLMQGLLTARQYFNSSTNADEIALRKSINALWDGVEWNWFTKNGTETNLYWHWSPNYNWDMNLPIRGWNEALITYVLAASSNTSPITKTIYDNSWAQNGQMKNGNSYYGIKLPLGPAYGGPLFFSQYSFLGINPHDLTDTYADYWQQNTAHSQINYTYCKTNPKQYSGYSADCWGLTASDQQDGYSARDPTNDNGTIAPTAALSSMPYTPTESMQALRFFYYKLGDKIWKDYGFVDAFNLNNIWFADSFLAIDQGPIIVMVENQRSQLLWKLFMSCPEVKKGMKGLGFQSPNLN